jgi:anti-anti-sigma factor
MPGIVSQREGPIATVAFRGELDGATCDALDRELAGALECDCEKVVLDLSGLAFLDSAGLRTILRARGRARELGKQFELVRPSPSVRRVLDVTGLG